MFWFQIKSVMVSIPMYINKFPFTRDVEVFTNKKEINISRLHKDENKK